MTFGFFFNFTTALMISFSVFNIFAPETTPEKTIFNISLFLIVTIICWRWGRYSLRRRGEYLYIHNFPACHKIALSDIQHLKVIDKHVLIDKTDDTHLSYHFMFGPAGGIHSSVKPLIEQYKTVSQPPSP